MNVKPFIIPFLFATLILIQSCNNGQPKDIVADNFNFAAQQLQYAIELTGEAVSKDSRDSASKARRPLASPRTLEEDGSLKMVPVRDWTSGFFPGELWFMYEKTGDQEWKERAIQFTEPLQVLRHHTGTHDLGFMVYNSFGNGLRLTGNSGFKEILLDAARSLSTRYKPGAKIIRSWDHNRDKWQCPVIIDNMMNLELLFWAFKESGDSTFYRIAVNHANSTMKNHFRPDYSTYHVVDYDTITGEVLNRHTHQGFAHESTWSRGQAWALYGYTLMYRETGDQAYLNQANHIAEYIFTHPRLPEDLIPYWDFDAPEIPDEPRDVSAAAVAASALYELSSYNGEHAGRYTRWADTVLENLTTDYRATPGADGGFLLLHSTGAKSLNSEIDVPLVYADYYYLEALLRKSRIEDNRPLF